jgi:hypothetical protein
MPLADPKSYDLLFDLLADLIVADLAAEAQVDSKALAQPAANDHFHERQQGCQQ